MKSSKDILAKKKKRKKKKQKVRYRTYMIRRLILLLIVIKQIDLEVIVRYVEFCFKYVKCDLST